jgi:hypothetical protein
LGLELLHQVRDDHIQEAATFTERWLPRLRVSDLQERREAVADGFDELRNAFSTTRQLQWIDWSSSINKAKGLEAIAVLAVASNLNQLQKWCMMDRTQRNADTTDTCRLGFVAFSRPMELLCIACLKPLDNQTRSDLQNLDVTFLPRRGLMGSSYTPLLPFGSAVEQPSPPASAAYVPPLGNPY